MNTPFDFHTHNPDAVDALISVEPGFTPRAGAVYSVGIHPWHSATVTDMDLRRLEADARLRCVKAIGETGLDRLRGATLDRQTELLLHHIALSEELHKPLVLHIVKAFPEIIAIKRRIKPSQTWIIHGFRGKPQLAEELLRHGFYLSLGEHFNPRSAEIIPSGRLLVETDESDRGIAELAAMHPHLDTALPSKLLGL
ncbi:TatD family hydrolase [uncultured Muribaculum sp.]|uniref:TatD family hydrolase n=1 Tax=uncultured Muribaculum sp. TaxID=1918613 RepID=UPI0025EA6FF5|nr:TatD family hydrolase [uncultured Muribaculum sp.]